MPYIIAGTDARLIPQARPIAFAMSREIIRTGSLPTGSVFWSLSLDGQRSIRLSNSGGNGTSSTMIARCPKGSTHQEGTVWISGTILSMERHRAIYRVCQNRCLLTLIPKHIQQYYICYILHEWMENPIREKKKRLNDDI